MNYIGKLENFQESLDYICTKITTKPIKAEFANGTLKNKKHYSDFYTKQTCEIVKEMYKEDIDSFNYTF